MKKIDVYSYSDYRLFLKDHAETKRKENPHWSLSVWARQLKSCNKTMLSMIMSGKRHPSDHLAESFCQYFKFNEDDADYFKNLVYFNKTGMNTPGGRVLSRHLDFRKSSKEKRVLEKQSFSAISEWYYYAIREMVRLKDFRNDPKWISKKFHYPLSSLKVKEAIGNLLSLNLLELKEGKLVPTHDQISSTDEISCQALKKFHVNSIKNSMRAVSAFAVEERYLGGITMPIKKENLPRAKELIRRFEDEFIELLEAGDGDFIYQLNTQFYPLTK